FFCAASGREAPFLAQEKHRQAQTKSYPCVEKYHLIWVWPGESQADESLIPWYPEFSDEKANFWGRSYECPVDASLWLENLMDLAHTPFAHDGQ
ncbi:unnamed protein product, partial [Effrenium voratum]